jgi:hypothetical protein
MLPAALLHAITVIVSREILDLICKNQAGPTMFSAYLSESPVKICSLLRSGNNFLFVGPSNSVFKSRSFLQ